MSLGRELGAYASGASCRMWLLVGVQSRKPSKSVQGFFFVVLFVFN